MRGGLRIGAGRPPVPTGTAMKKRSIRLHDNEYELVKAYVKKLRLTEFNGNLIPANAEKQ